MRVLLLGEDAGCMVFHFVRNQRINTLWFQDKVLPTDMAHIDLIISYNYRHIIPPEVIDIMQGRIINLHISLLPYNRGADPNFWSWITDTPKGVTIHQIDKGIDTGDILFQKEVFFTGYPALRESYAKLHDTMYDLFCANWHLIRDGKLNPLKQVGKGSYHKRSQMLNLIEGIKDTYLDMPTDELCSYVGDLMSSAQDRDRNYPRQSSPTRVKADKNQPNRLRIS